MATVALGAERRTGRGKGPARQLRLNGRIPAVIYGHGREPESLSLSEKDLEQALTGIAAGSTVFDLSIDGATVKALIREIQRHPVRPRIVHVDFLEVHAGEKVTVEVPLHLTGTPDGVRNAGGVLDQLMRQVKIKVEPTEIPAHIEVDVTNLRVGTSLHVSDLPPGNYEILEEATDTICTVVAPRIEEEPVVAAAAAAPEEAAEPELIRKPKEEEGEEGEGEEKEE
jgi:large subunit ribosomal protein L25